MRQFSVRNLKWFLTHWTENLVVLESASGQNHMVDTSFPLIQWKDVQSHCCQGKEAGVVLYRSRRNLSIWKDPKDSNIRIAPSFPTPEDLGKAAEVFVLCVKLTSVEKLLATVC